MERVRGAAAGLREAIAGQSFERAIGLLREYAAMLETAGPAAMGEAAEVLAGLRREALARRAHLAARLDELNRITPYLKSVPRRRGLRLEG
jgi:hypothetical protein